MAANGNMDLKRKQMIVSSLCQHFSLDPKPFLGDIAENDIKTLYSNILKSSGNESSLQNNDEVMKWIKYAENFPSDSTARFGVLKELNEDLVPKSVLWGKGLRPSEVDVIVFSALHSSVLGLSDSDKEKLPHVMRWMDYIQNKEGLGKLFGAIFLEKPGFEHQLQAKNATKVEVDPNAKKTTQSSKSSDKSEVDPSPNAKKTMQSSKSSDKSEADPSTKKSDSVAAGKKNATQEKKKSPETEAVDKDKEVSVSLLNIQVGLIHKAWKHPSADSLLVEEIDVGEAKLRQVVSGLAKYCSPDELMNRRVVLITNVKPGKLRDVMSEGLVLCASNEDHTVVEPLLPPEGAKPGERVSFSGIDGKPEEVLNPKKKQLEKITPQLFTDDKGVATFKGIPFMTSAGPCTSSIPKASIK